MGNEPSAARPSKTAAAVSASTIPAAVATDTADANAESQIDLSWKQLVAVPKDLLAQSAPRRGSVTAFIADFNQFSAFPEELGTFPSLKELSLASNQIGALPPLSRFTGLRTLVLGGNQLTNSASLETALSALSSLTELNLASNQLTALPVALQHMRELTDLSVAQNALSSLLLRRASNSAAPAPAAAAAADLKADIKADTAPVPGPDTGGRSLWVLPSSLRKLNVNGNAIAALELPAGEHWSKRFPALTQLDVSENRLTVLPPGLSAVPNLKNLFAACNGLREFPWAAPDGGAPAGAASSAVSAWPKLQRLDLSYNLFSDFGSTGAQTLPSLTSLEINGNPLSASYTPMPIASTVADSKTRTVAAASSAPPALSSTPALDALRRAAPAKLQLRCDYPLPDEIVPRLYLGCYQCARNQSGLASLGITHVLTVAFYRPLYESQFTYKVIAVDDKDIEDLLVHMKPAVDFITDALNSHPKNKVFVHCRHGVSRSATMVTAYVMATQRLRLEPAFALVKAKRPRVGPNAGFRAQMLLWEKQVFGDATSVGGASAASAGVASDVIKTGAPV